MLVTERPGRLRIVEKGRLLPEPVAGTPAPWAVQDGGLLDVEVHPRYAENGWIYLAYAVPGPNDTSMTAIVRGRLRGHRWVDAAGRLQAGPRALRTAELPLRLAIPFRPRGQAPVFDRRPRSAGGVAGPGQSPGQGAPRQRRRDRARRQSVRRAHGRGADDLDLRPSQSPGALHRPADRPPVGVRAWADGRRRAQPPRGRPQLRLARRLARRRARHHRDHARRHGAAGRVLDPDHRSQRHPLLRGHALSARGATTCS